MEIIYLIVALSLMVITSTLVAASICVFLHLMNKHSYETDVDNGNIKEPRT